MRARRRLAHHCCSLALSLVWGGAGLAGIGADARGQAPSARLLSLATTRQDSSEIRSLVGGLGRHLPLFTQDSGKVTYAATEGVVEEGPGVVRVWLVVAERGRVLDALRARLQCNGRVTMFAATARGETLLDLSDSSAMAAATCRLIFVAQPTREQDPGGRAVAARLAADSATQSLQRWRAVMGAGSLEIAPASRRETPAGIEAWVRYGNRAGGKTVALITVDCKEETRQLLQGSGTDSTGAETRLLPGDRERVAPESAEEWQLLAVCRRAPLAPLAARHGDPVPPTLLTDVPAELPTITVQALLDAGPTGWLASVMRRLCGP